MRQGCDDIAIVCCLTSAELRERAETLLAQFRSAVIGIEELRDGYAFRVPGEGKWIATIAEMIVAEKRVLPLLDIRVGCPARYGASNRSRDWSR
jgi:hypothetical protein